MELNKIYNMDCIDGLKQMSAENIEVDCILTSPPYNIIRPNQNDRGYDLYNDGMSNEEYCDWIVSLFKLFDDVLDKDGKIIWNMSYGSENTECMNLTIAEILKRTNFTIADIIVWKKSSAYPNDMSKNKLTRICEFVYVFCRRSEFNTFNTNKRVTSVRHTGQNNYENIFNIFEAPNNDAVTNLNKATFSTEFVTKLLEIYCNKTETVLDPFMGTGTTAVACKRRGNKYIGFELSDKQCEYANKWLNSTKTISSLF